jgi:hypothetical protein
VVRWQIPSEIHALRKPMIVRAVRRGILLIWMVVLPVGMLASFEMERIDPIETLRMCELLGLLGFGLSAAFLCLLLYTVFPMTYMIKTWGLASDNPSSVFLPWKSVIKFEVGNDASRHDMAWLTIKADRLHRDARVALPTSEAEREIVVELLRKNLAGKEVVPRCDDIRTPHPLE